MTTATTTTTTTTTIMEQRRRNRVTEWDHEQCPVSIDKTIVIGGGGAIIQSSALQVNGVQSMPLVSTVEMDESTDSPTQSPTHSPTSSPTNSPSQSPTFHPSSGPTQVSTKIGPHHFLPLDLRSLDTRSDRSVFSKTQDLFLHRHTEEILEDTEYEAAVGQRFGHSKRPDWSNDNNSDYKMGLVSIAICVLTVVIGWLILLAIAWKLNSKNRKHQHKTIRFESSHSVESNQNQNTALEQPEEQERDINEWYQDIQPQIEMDNEEENNAPIICMECESAASPRWMSFPDTSFALESVRSFFTNTPSLASQDGNKEVSAWKKNKNNNNNNNNNMSMESNQLFYKIGVVRDGRVEVASPDDSFVSAPSMLKEENSGLPWNEILGNIFADIFGWDDDDNYQHENTNNTSFVSDNTSDTNGSPNQDDILRDLEELEHQVSSQRSSRDKNNVSVELQDLLELESGIARGKLEEQLRESQNDASTISSLLTTAVQQKNQEDLLQEEGVEIWYDAQNKMFFKNDHTFDNNSYAQFQPSSVSSAMAGQSIGSRVKDEHSNTRKRSFFGFLPWPGLGLGYKFLQLPESDSVSDATPKTRKQMKQNRNDPILYSQSQVYWMKFGRLVFFFSGVVIIISSISMAIFGANTLARASASGSSFVQDAQALALEGSNLVHDFVGSSLNLNSENNILSSSTRSSNTIHSNSSLFDVFDTITQQLYRSTNAYCDFGNQDLPVDDALNSIVDIWDQHILVPSPSEGIVQTQVDRDILTKIEDFQKDLLSVSNTTASLDETWLQPFNVVVLLLRVGNSLLGVSCLLLLLGSWRHSLGHPKYKYFVIPLYTTLVVMSLVACLTFLMGSTTLQDVCGANPDDQVLEFLSSFETVEVNQPWSDNDPSEDKAWLSLSHGLAKEYIQQCPYGEMEDVPSTVESIAERGWEFSRALWEVSALLTNNGTCVNERIPALVDDSGRSPIVAMGELVMQTSCNFSVLLTELVDVFACDNWYQLYEEAVHETACTLGRSGFVWVTVTQFFIVVLSLVMLTVRVIMGWPDKDLLDNALTNAQNESNLPDKTMLIEEEDDFNNSGSVEDPFASLDRDDGADFYRASAYDNDNPFAEEPNQMIKDPYDRSPDRILRKSPQLNKKKKKGGNYLASMALYSIGGATFEAAHEYEEDYDYDDDDDPNIEVCLHPYGIGCRSEKKRTESMTKSKIKYFHTTCDELFEVSDTSSAEDYDVEVDRVRSRLGGIREKKRKSTYKLVAEDTFE